MPTTKRLFLAFRPEGTILEKNITELLRELNLYPSLLKPVSPQNFHLTIKFIGNVSPLLFNEIVNAFNNFKSAVSPIDYSVKGIGAFPSMESPQIIWSGLSADKIKLQQLLSEVESMLIPLGFEPEKRSFKPHITLARVKKLPLPADLIKLIQSNNNLILGEGSMDRLLLFNSELLPDGPRYTKIAECKLIKKIYNPGSFCL